MQDFSLRCRMKEKGIDVMPEQNIPEIKGSLRDFMLKVPEPIYRCSGIKILGRRIKSVLFGIRHRKIVSQTFLSLMARSTLYHAG